MSVVANSVKRSYTWKVYSVKVREHTHTYNGTLLHSVRSRWLRLVALQPTHTIVPGSLSSPSCTRCPVHGLVLKSHSTEEVVVLSWVRQSQAVSFHDGESDCPEWGTTQCLRFRFCRMHQKWITGISTSHIVTLFCIINSNVSMFTFYPQGQTIGFSLLFALFYCPLKYSYPHIPIHQDLEKHSQIYW